MSDPTPGYSGYGVPVDGIAGPPDGNPPDGNPPEADPAGPADPNRRDRRRTWIIGGGVTAIVLVAVGWVWFVRSPVGLLAQAVATTLEQGSSATQVNATLRDLPLVGDIDLMVAEGEVEFTSGEARFRRNLFGGVESELRYVDEGVFLAVPFAEDRWVELASSESTVASLPTDVTSVAPGLGNPLALLGLLRSLESSPTELGRDDVGGTPVTTYEVVVDLDAAAQLLGADERDVVERLGRVAGGGELPLEVAIDDDELIRRVRFTTTVPLSQVLQPRLDTEIVFTEFGVPVEVAAPAPDRIVELDPSLLAELDPLGAIRGLLERIPGLN